MKNPDFTKDYRGMGTFGKFMRHKTTQEFINLYDELP